MKINFKMVLACVCAAGSMNSFSQQYFRASANGGISTIQYSADEISSKLFAPSSIGGGVTAEYIRFFNQYVGASAGIGVSMFQSKYELNTTLNSAMTYYSFEDNKAREFVYNAKFDNWVEEQMIHTVDIPVGAVGKYSFSDKITGLAGLGVRFQLPVKATYKIAEDGSRTTTGYYNEANVVLKNIPHQGFYTLNGGQEGELNTKTISFAAYLDLGVQHEIAGQQFYYGIYGQYGFTQVNSVAENSFLTQYGPYDSPLNTKDVDKSRLLSFGIKIGYILPFKSDSIQSDSTAVDLTEEKNPESASIESEASENDTQVSSLKPERDDHPYTPVSSESSTLSMESPKETVATESPKKENIFKRVVGKFKKKDKKSEENKD